MRKRKITESRFGYCQCGCGELAPIAEKTNKTYGWVAGQPKKYIRGHNNRLANIEYIEEDRGFTSPCWIWQLARAKFGYGLTKDERGKTVTAHRVYYKRLKGPIPKKYQLDHLCRVRECVNPDHLEAVTNAENARRGWMTRLERYQVERIHVLYAAGVNKEELAKLFDITPQYVGRILAGKKWVAT